MKTTPFIRVPALDAGIFDQSLVVSLTEQFINERDNVLEATSAVVMLLEDNTLSTTELLSALEEYEINFDSQEALQLFNDGVNCHNLARYLIEAQRNSNASASTLLKVANEKFPIMNYIESSLEEQIERLSRLYERQYGEFYPLYCRPNEETILHFIQYCPGVAFAEVGSGNYFAYLTSSGRLMANEIAYAYLKVDGDIPSNIQDGRFDKTGTDDIVIEALTEYFKS